MIRILIVDDHAIVREGLKQIVSETSDMVVAGEATRGEEAVAMVRHGAFDVVVLDISMPGRSGLEVLKELKAMTSSPQVLVLSIHPEEQYAVRALKAGAAGYLTKESAPDELIEAIWQVSQGKKYITPSVTEELVFDLEGTAEKYPHENLSNRELQVLYRIAQGQSIREIGQELRLSVKTVSTYRSRVLVKMSMKTNADLIHYAVKRGLVD